MKRVAEKVGVIVVLAAPIIVGVFAGGRNTASWVGGWGVGLIVGVGVLAVAGALFALIEQTAKKKLKEDILWILAIYVIGAMPILYWVGLPWVETRAFAAHLPEYVDIAASANPQQGEPLREHIVGGKILPLDMKKKRIDEMFFELSRDSRPKNPEEVGAIAGLWWEEVKVGTYGGMGGAYREECRVIVWDLATRKLLAERFFSGSDPPSSTVNSMFAHHGDKPYEEIRDYLNGLTH
jgi:hypothetical protein